MNSQKMEKGGSILASIDSQQKLTHSSVEGTDDTIEGPRNSSLLENEMAFQSMRAK